MFGELATRRRAALDRGIAAFREADPGAAEPLHEALNFASRGGFGARFDADLAHFYLSELNRIQGFEAMFRGRFHDALRLLEISTRHNPENFQALYAAGVCANAIGEYDKAIACLGQLFDVERCTRRLITHLAVVLINAGRLDQASERLEQQLHENPRFADLNQLLGICRWKQGRRSEAVALFRNALAADPQLGAAQLRLGAALVLCGDTAGAAETLGDALHATTLPPLARDLLEALCGLDDASQSWQGSEHSIGPREFVEKLAEDVMHTPLPLNPLSVGLHVSDDEVGAGARYYDALAAAYEALIREVPHHARLHYRLGRLLQRLERPDEARKRYERALELDPRSSAWPGVAELLGIEPPETAEAPPTGRYDEARDGVNWAFDPAAVPCPCFPAHIVRPLGGLRRTIDVVVALAALLAAAPVFALLALAIRIDSRGPVLFAQKRVGWNGRRFTIYKFRTMFHGAEVQDAEHAALNDADGPMFKIKDDPRVTRVGRMLRRRSLDELPQFLNVLRGEMTILGPRPLIEREVAQMTDWELRRLIVTPGLVCLAQICGRSDLRFHESIRLDTYYVAKRGMALDLGIAWRAVESVVAGKGAY